MDPHPDFATSSPPRSAVLGTFHLTPLDPSVVDEDFAVVTGSSAVLKGLFGDDWPVGLTLSENAIDLAWHEREFTSSRSFAWVTRDGHGTYLGCAYVYPDLGTRGSGTVITWMRDRADRAALLTAFNDVFMAWIAAYLPAGGEYALTTNADF
ncbi:hypothetical protein [Rhodovulum sp. FJ3]|uniref:hypothetical protein n=1 Tax=Rhodovulum sp. FJ3 TaxID=3079053 RepID=UPI002943440F|nr:hypothetical protein [Rhodovulum sp. FJ3]